jgi:hypothetical protein
MVTLGNHRYGVTAHSHSSEAWADANGEAAMSPVSTIIASLFVRIV